MRKSLFLICLISLVMFNVSATFVVPGSNETVYAASFLPSALLELENQSKFVLFNEEGFPYGFIDDGSFVTSLQYGNLTILPYLGEDSVVIGSSSLESASLDIASLRNEYGEEIDWDLLRENDFSKYAYYSQRYDDLEDFLKEGLGVDTKQKSIDFMNELNPSALNDLNNVFEALEDQAIGNSHYDELLDVLNKMNNEDLSKYLDEETLSKVNEFMDDLKTDLAKDLLKNIIDNVGKDELKLLYDLMKQIDPSILFDIAKEYTRKLASDGTLDKIGETLKDLEISSEIKKTFAEGTKNFLKNTLWDILPKNISYYLLALAVLIFTLSLRRVGG